MRNRFRGENRDRRREREYDPLVCRLLQRREQAGSAMET